jgi:hypothetical protein
MGIGFAMGAGFAGPLEDIDRRSDILHERFPTEMVLKPGVSGQFSPFTPSLLSTGRKGNSQSFTNAREIQMSRSFDALTERTNMRDDLRNGSLHLKDVVGVLSRILSRVLKHLVSTVQSLITVT